ncbi:WD40-repeat-containing domain protein [Sporodiniella umbellata]|nr:WD40-repeat-containing domain protein [Sporodiniella umbellata]
MSVHKEVSFTPYDIKWLPESTEFCAVGCTKRGNGYIGIYQISDGQIKLKSETSMKTALRCIATAGQKRYIVTGDFDGRIQVWDTHDLKKPVSDVKGHDAIVNCIASLDEPSQPVEFVTGSRDGRIKVWDTRQEDKPVLAIHSKRESSDIWAVAIGWINGHKMIAAGYESGKVKLFTIDEAEYIWAIQVQGGVCSIKFGEDKLLVSTVSGAYVIDVSDSEVLHLETPKNTTIWKIKSMDTKDCIVTSGGDGKLSAYRISESKKPYHVLDLSKHPITTLDLNKDQPDVFVCGAFDNTIRVGIIPNPKTLTKDNGCSNKKR